MKRMSFTWKKVGESGILLLLLLIVQTVTAQTTTTQTAGTISLELKDTPLPDALKQIEKAGGKTFFLRMVRWTVIVSRHLSGRRRSTKPF
ncbi:MAG: hypothetical protein LUF01_11105 [Bacteroides sp.]|nr:hypothetical protein [Bacteroides sp.]